MKNFYKKVLTFVGAGGKICLVLERQDKTEQERKCRADGNRGKAQKGLGRKLKPGTVVKTVGTEMSENKFEKT